MYFQEDVLTPRKFLALFRVFHCMADQNAHVRPMQIYASRYAVFKVSKFLVLTVTRP